jgi:hypothetical protein
MSTLIEGSRTVEIVSGAKPGDQFVRKYTDKSSSSFGLKDAIKLASPENRSL